MNKNLKKIQTLATYNKTAKEMSEKFNTRGVRAYDIKKAFSFIKNPAPFVLEVGCGHGRDAKEILKHTSNYIGIDFSFAMIQLAKEYIPESAHQFFLVDVEDYTFPKDLDIIFSFASLLHTDKAHLREILIKGYKSLVSGGIFYISLKYSPYYEELTKEDEFGTRTYYFYNPEEIIEIISDICTDHQIAFQYIGNQKWFTLILIKN